MLALLTQLALAAPAAAAPKDAVFNKAGVWGLDVDSGSCAASMLLKDGSTFLLRATAGKINVAYFARGPVPRGKVGRLETEAYGFDFEPGYDGRNAIYTAEYVNDRTVAALRLARDVKLLTDGKMVVQLSLENTGFEEALDGLLACSRGEAGWWGEGVQPAEGGKAAALGLPLNKEGFWFVVPGDAKAICSAAVKLEGGGAFTLVAAEGALSFGLSTEGAFRKGRRGRFEIDGLGVDFTPGYEGKDYLYSREVFSAPAIAALRQASSVAASIDGKSVLDIALEGSGHAQVMTDLAACARGEAGWWGKGAPQPGR